MAHRNGQRVVITITDKQNRHSPVTVLRGYVSDPEAIMATCDDGHPIWHGAVLRYGEGIKFKAEPRDVKSRLGVKEFKRPVKCFACRRRSTLATASPHKCLECCLEAEKDSPNLSIETTASYPKMLDR